MLPRPRIPRRVVAIAAAGGLAVAALGLTGCDYAAGPGSGADIAFGGCGDTATLVRGCSRNAVLSNIRIYDKSRGEHPLASGNTLTRDLNGGSISLGEVRYNAEFNYWQALLGWPKDGQAAADPNSPIRQHLVSEPSGIGVFSDRWLLDSVLPTRAAANLPAKGDLPVAPVASLFSHDSPAASGPAPLKPTVVDARQSTGTGVTYSWDTNGDGTFGDPPKGGWTNVADPTDGTAYLPQSVVASSIPAPAVKVTDSSLQTSTTTISIPTWDQGAGGLVVAAGGSRQINLTPDIGTLPTGNDPIGHVHYVCIDIGDDGTYDTAQQLRFSVSYPTTGFAAYPAPIWTGVKLVRVDFFADVPVGADDGTCFNRNRGAQILSTHVELVNGDTKVAMERGAHATAKVKRYTGTARVRLASGTMLSPGTQSGNAVNGIVNRGRYSLRAPARGGGAARPAALAAFASGDFASSSNASLGFAEDGTASIVGTTTMVIRGKKKALACINVAQTDSSTIWTMMGGTGAARTLRMVMNGGATANSLMTTAVPEGSKVTGKGKAASMALAPVSTSYSINASKGSGRGISSACRALVKRLP
ncbi:MAG: hypothetical protein WCK40_07660 [Thermoleophilia bacterium]